MSTTSALVTTSAANIYASSGNTAITWLSITNYTASTNALANVHVVPSGGSANAQNLILRQIEIAGGDTYQLYAAGEKLLLENNTAIQAVANTNSVLTIVVSYTTI